jgi:hypothetical protein
VRDSESCNAVHYANDAYARAETMRLRYPQRAYNRSHQFADYIRDNMDGFPESVATSFWVGIVYRWLDKPMHGEENMFVEAKEELGRLNDERRREWVVS